MLSIQLSSDAFSWISHTGKALVMVTKKLKTQTFNVLNFHTRNNCHSHNLQPTYLD